MYIYRDISDAVLTGHKKHHLLALSGPIGSGKTTLVKHLFKEYTYVSMKDRDLQIFARNDPDAFLQTSCTEKNLIIDDIDSVPELISKIDGYSWGTEKIILVSSRTLPEVNNIREFVVLPFSVNELAHTGHKQEYLDDLIYQGFFPALYHPVDAKEWYANYIQLILKNRKPDSVDTEVFTLFLRLVAGRMGSLLNYGSLADDCGISQEEVYRWIQFLEERYIVFLLWPSTKNYGKRLEKKPKLYFYDTGLAAYLLRIKHVSFSRHYLRREFLEALVLSEILKSYYNDGVTPQITYWRDIAGHELPILLQDQQELFPIEVNVGKTISASFFKKLNFWNELTNADPKNGFVVYEGTKNQAWSLGKVIGWNAISDIRRRIKKSA